MAHHYPSVFAWNLDITWCGDFGSIFRAWREMLLTSTWQKVTMQRKKKPHEQFILYRQKTFEVQSNRPTRSWMSAKLKFTSHNLLGCEVFACKHYSNGCERNRPCYTAFLMLEEWPDWFAYRHIFQRFGTSNCSAWLCLRSEGQLGHLTYAI